MLAVIGPLRPGSYLTPDGGMASDLAIIQLALPRPMGTQLYVHTFIVKPGEYAPAPNSIPGTRMVRPANGHIGLGIEYVNTVPLVPVGPSYPAPR